MKKALITGVTGQDGSYLCRFLIKKGYQVHGIIRRASTFNTSRIDDIYQDPHEKVKKLILHYGDLSDSTTIYRLIYKIQPDEVYNLAAQSHVRVSFDIPEYTANIVALGPMRILEAIKDFQTSTGKKIKFYQASSSEMFGSAKPPQNEHTPFQPRSPYAISKVFAHFTTINYREAYGLYAVSGILFNHESPVRGETFVTRKITRGIARILAGLDEKLYLGDLKPKRDWGSAPEYVEAMWRMMQLKKPQDFVIGTGKSNSVKTFLDEAFAYVGIKNWKPYVAFDPHYLRPTEVDNLIADTRKMKRVLKWTPKTDLKGLIKWMMDKDLEKVGLKKAGGKIVKMKAVK